ncbi:MAG: hypothetical protein ABJJ12_14370, partial [Marinomonas sp.]
SMLDEKFGKLADSIENLTAQMDGGQGATAALDRVAEGQERLIEMMISHGPAEGIDAESRMRLRSIDVQMLRILEEISAGRQESMTELRTDIAALSRAITTARSPAPMRSPPDSQEE